MAETPKPDDKLNTRSADRANESVESIVKNLISEWEKGDRGRTQQDRTKTLTEDKFQVENPWSQKAGVDKPNAADARNTDKNKEIAQNPNWLLPTISLDDKVSSNKIAKPDAANPGIRPDAARLDARPDAAKLDARPDAAKLDVKADTTTKSEATHGAKQQSSGFDSLLPPSSTLKPAPADSTNSKPANDSSTWLPGKPVPADAPWLPRETRPETFKPQRPAIETPEQVFELKNLEYRAASHGKPDAIVRLPKNFDPSKPINVVIYNHGWGDSAQSSFTNADLNRQMRQAADNTVLIVPEWQRNPGSRTSNQGYFAQKNHFQNMMQEVFDKTPGLTGKRFADVNSISIIGHSAGYNPSETQLYKNDIAHKITSVTVLDGLYNPSGYDSWLQDNIHDLASGKKQFYNIFQGTSGNSKAQADRITNMLRRAGYSDSVYRDYRNGGNVTSPAEFARNNIVFKYSDASVDGKGPHGSVPNLYISALQAAARMRQKP